MQRVALKTDQKQKQAISHCDRWYIVKMIGEQAVDHSEHYTNWEIRSRVDEETLNVIEVSQIKKAGTMVRQKKLELDKIALAEAKGKKKRRWAEPSLDEYRNNAKKRKT